MKWIARLLIGLLAIVFIYFEWQVLVMMISICLFIASIVGLVFIVAYLLHKAGWDL